MNPPYIETGTSAGVRLAAIFAGFILLAGWMKHCVARAPLGWARLWLSLPVLAANIVCPFFFDITVEVLPRTSTLFIFSWLCNFKVLAFCLGRAPLRESMTWVQMAAVITLPVFPKPAERAKAGPEGRLQDSAGPGTGLAMRWLGKIALLGAVVYTELVYGEVLPRVVVHYVHAFGVYSFVGFLMDGPGALAVEALGLQLVPTFDQPWLSSSLADFWGRRWNITTSSVLRTLVYDPIVEGSLIDPRRLRDNKPAGPTHKQVQQQQDRDQEAKQEPKQAPGAKEQAQQHQAGQQAHRRPSRWRVLLGLHATFLASGLVHEYMAWNVSGLNRWHWKWTLFFYLQAPLMTAEWAGRKALRRAGRRGPPSWLAVPATLAILEATAYHLFFGFVERDCNLVYRVITAVGNNYTALLQPLWPLLAALRGS